MCGIVCRVYFQMLRQFGNGFLHPFDDALGDLIGTVRIKVRIVCKIPGLSRIRSCRIVDESTFGSVRSQRLVQGTCHFIEIDQGNILFGCQPAHRFRIVFVCVADMSVGVETTTLGRSDKHRMRSACTRFVNECFQTGHEGVVSSFARPFLLLVVVTELHKEIISLFDLA